MPKAVPVTITVNDALLALVEGDRKRRCMSRSGYAAEALRLLLERNGALPVAPLASSQVLQGNTIPDPS